MRYSFALPETSLPELPPPASDAPSVLAFSMPKAGSTLLERILQALAPEVGLAHVSLDEFFFRAGVPPADRPPQAARLFRPVGYLYGGFRSRPRYDIPILPTARAVLLVRDPRDMIVSHYYSVTRSHRIPDLGEGEGTAGPHYLLRQREQAQRRTIAEHARATAQSYARNFDGYLAGGMLWRDNLAVYRYEDVIFEKRAWVADMCRWFGWSVPRERSDAIADRFDIRPERADPEAHVRQVAPGNHREELPAETIELLNRGPLEPHLRLFGYL
jgi:hypothetical protein